MNYITDGLKFIGNNRTIIIRETNKLIYEGVRYICKAVINLEFEREYFYLYKDATNISNKKVDYNIGYYQNFNIKLTYVDKIYAEWIRYNLAEMGNEVIFFPRFNDTECFAGKIEINDLKILSTGKIANEFDFEAFEIIFKGSDILVGDNFFTYNPANILSI